MTHRTLLLPVVLGAALVGCKVEEPNPPAERDDVALRRMADCDDVRDRLADTLTDQLLGYGHNRWFGPVEDDATTDAGAEDGGGGAPEPPTDYTGTNVQEAGVDELDLVKTDGSHLFVAQDRALRVVKSWPAADTELLASLPLTGWARGLFRVDDDTLVVLEDVSGYVETDGGWWGALRALVVDVSDPTAPAVEHTIDVEGWLADARMVDGQIYLVLNQYLHLPDAVWEQVWLAASSLPWPETGDEATWEAARLSNHALLRARVGAILAGVDVASVLPGWRDDVDAEFTSLYACDDLYAPAQVTPLGMLSVAQLDASTGALTASGLMSDGWTVYASTDALYVGQTSAWWWGFDGDVGQTHIHRFALGGSEPAYTGSGAVTGWLYDQFAMSEYEGDLRVVTTDFGWWGAVDVGVAEEGDVAVGSGGGDVTDPVDEPVEVEPEPDPDAPGDTPDMPQQEDPEDEPEVDDRPANHVFVLRQDEAGNLDVIGHVGRIAPGETVQAVRMMGEKGYVITFERTDPLFTLDLSDPMAPAVVGELHMPGFSAYLHPLGDDHLIGVGMAGLETGQLTGLAINLFDVSDMANPQLVDQYELSPGEQSWAWSEAMWDHHAFTFHRDVLTIPAATESWNQQTGEYTGFSGTISLRVTVADGIEEVGWVDHHDLALDSQCIYDILWADDGRYAEGDVDDGGDRDEPSDGDDSGASEGSEGGEVGEPEPEPVEETDPPDDGVEDWSYCDYQYGYWYAQVRRSVYVEDNLYTISDYGVKVTDLNDPSTEHARVLFYPPVSE